MRHSSLYKMSLKNRMKIFQLYASDYDANKFEQSRLELLKEYYINYTR